MACSSARIGVQQPLDPARESVGVGIPKALPKEFDGSRLAGVTNNV